jgi:DNA polymerase sigma
MKEVICVSTAKVPIVKILDPELNLACDMNVNNTLALENTRMIKTYVEIDPRIRPLAMIIKHWTKRRIVNDAGKIVSYSSTSFMSDIMQLLVELLVLTLGYA